MELAPGKTIAVEITALPRSAGACKTLTRVFAKDPAVVRARRWQYRHRPSWEAWRRGGNMWHHQMKTKPTFELTVGRRITLLATVDVVRDLQSVNRWVQVTAQ